ncbi:MAG: hypothetical protein C0625_10045 [Arcobacter sp.]|nr:MAG: hypothetical protein C0625_10045 [Arcobacter sp.]
MNKTKDSFTLLLLFFTIIITTLFFYLYYTKNNMKNYSYYHDSFDYLLSLNSKFNYFIVKKDIFVNFDKIVKDTDEFENTLNNLINSNLKKEFGSALLVDIVNISSLYEKKKVLIERFKARQATNLNSIHYIYDLNEYFSKSKELKDEVRLVINDTLFMMMQDFIQLNDTRSSILKNLEYLENKNKELKNKKLKFLNIHIYKILKNIDFMNKIKKESDHLNISKKLKLVQNKLINKHKKELFNQLLISSFFFFSVIIVIIMIYLEHKKSSKIKNELLAFKYAIENSDNSVIITDVDRNILYVNDIFEKITGFLKDEVQGQTPKLLSSGETPLETYIELNKKLEAGEKWEGEFINKRKDGSIFYEKASIVPIVVDNELKNYLAIKLDVTNYIKQNESIRLSSIAFDNIQEGILICGSDKNIITVNKAFELISGYSKEELIGKKPNLLKSGNHDKIFYKQMWLDINEKAFWRGKVYDKRKNGEIVPFWLNITVVKNDKNKVINYVAVHTSLKEIIESQEKADFFAYHDSLTKLPNRVKLEENLDYSIIYASRNKLNLFVLFIDLDRFKNINDTLGHGIGDKLLINISKKIKNVLRDTDILARMGGDEFIVILDSNISKKAAGYVCRKILQVIKEPIIIDNNNLNTSASIGVAMYPDDGKDITTLIKNADTAMYHAKRLGKDNYQYYDKQLSLDVHEQLLIEQSLKDSIVNNEMFLNYQPQYNLKNKNTVAFEALVRWIHPKLGFVSPDKFIEIAEDTGDIIDIGRFVFDTACRDFVEFKKINQNLEYIAINISSVQFKDQNFVNDVLFIINKYGLNSSEVELEITERYIMEFSENNMKTINALRELGFRFSIDDFGTGYSSLSYLTKLPIDVIKVDKAFVDGTPNDHNNAQISKAIVVLSKSLGYKVIAEGIESIEQEEYLKTLDCELGQGYFFSKPLTFIEIIDFLKK